ncbi:ABC transporter permease [Streptomyces sp. ISL-66]|uniref:ABC transporter permease n=1 Tax=Streptomyces sp. ISL-66 TaxID=2819186 RepID=UPI001BE9DF46|nr:FtsX-like permease family protein [Streptomyces sp. ISL-66]MBT2468249.1 ABC transporter permease [Streptomyces sp. ISL-66]
MNLATNTRAWSRDLAMGVRFAFGGGRDSWIRTLFTGVGVGLGVALLLVTAALPSALTARTDRGDARGPVSTRRLDGPGPDTLLIASANQEYRGKEIDGVLIKAEGPHAPHPPGLTKIPGPGQLAVSPALADLLESGEGALLRERLGGEITEVIGDAGLVGPGELVFYLGEDRLQLLPGDEPAAAERANAFGDDIEPDELDPVLALMLVLTFVALLMPVVVFVAAAIRFGGDRRDRRLAALRLVGADGRMVRRIAAGEALAGSLIGLGLGTAFFLIARRLVGSVTLNRRSVFPADLDPSWWLAALVVLAVPAASVAVALFTLRGVIIEPLGVVRSAGPVRRRIWWRLLLPVGGIALLAPVGGVDDRFTFDRARVCTGVVLLLVGVTALLPWLLERLVGVLSGGPVSWQLAVRRLQVSSGSAARLVNGIAVAVAGAIALQMLFAGTESSYTADTGQDPGRASLAVSGHGWKEAGAAEALGKELAGVRGVAKATALTHYDAAGEIPAENRLVQFTVGTCEALREVARLETCRDGDVFVLNEPTPQGYGRYTDTARPGEQLLVGAVMGYADQSPPVRWTVPADARTAASRVDPMGDLRTGVLATPSAAPQLAGNDPYGTVFVQLDPAVPDAIDLARNAVFRADPTASAGTLVATRRDSQYGSIRSGLSVGAVLVLVLIGLSLLVAQLEQLRERRKLLSALVAFGTPRRTLALSVLWQTALPVTVAMALAGAVGLALGSVLLGMTGMPGRFAWGPVLGLAGAGAGMVVLVTLLSLPPLLRMMRPDGLRTE